MQAVATGSRADCRCGQVLTALVASRCSRLPFYNLLNGPCCLKVSAVATGPRPRTITSRQEDEPLQLDITEGGPGKLFCTPETVG